MQSAMQLQSRSEIFSQINSWFKEGKGNLVESAFEDDLKLHSPSAEWSLVRAADPKDGRTLLHLACGHGSLKLIERIISLGGDPDVRCTRDGESPLHQAARFGRVEAIQTLFKVGGQRMNVEAEDRNGNTALHLAAQTNKYAAVKDLLDRGLGLFENNSGKTPLEMAKESRFIRPDSPVLNLLKRAWERQVVAGISAKKRRKLVEPSPEPVRLADSQPIHTSSNNSFGGMTGARDSDTFFDDSLDDALLFDVAENLEQSKTRAVTPPRKQQPLVARNYTPLQTQAPLQPNYQDSQELSQLAPDSLAGSQSLSQPTGPSTQPVAANKPALEPHVCRNKSHPHKCEDGHFVISKSEKIIDDELDKAGIHHQYEPTVWLINPRNNESIHFVPDWYLPKDQLYMEYWGLPNDPKYASRMAFKRAVYQRNGLKWIDLYEEDVKDIKKMLPLKIQRMKQQL